MMPLTVMQDANCGRVHIAKTLGVPKDPKQQPLRPKGTLSSVMIPRESCRYEVWSVL